MHASQPTSFDKFAFVKYMKDIGGQYRKQAVKLVSISRDFVQAQEQTRNSHDELIGVLQVVDDALSSATEARKKTSNDADAKFKKAIGALSAFEKKYHTTETVTRTMAEAEAKDKSSSTILRTLKETFRPLKEEPTKIVEFLLHRSLPDKNPTIVKQVVSESSGTKEILWNFSRFKGERRLTLKNNPHFYERLSKSAENYEGQFQADPIETFFQQEKISVLTDNPRLTGRVFLETTEKKRAFGNVWVPKKAIIFKDVNGKLEGESIVGEAIQNTHNLWCFEEPPLSNASCSSLSNRSTPSPTMSASPTVSPTGSLIYDWREPILRMLRSQDVNIRIRILPPTNASLSSSVLSSPIPSSVPSNSDDSLLSPNQLQRHTNIMAPLGSTGPPDVPTLLPPASPPASPPSLPTPAPLQNTVSLLPLLPTGPALDPTTTSPPSYTGAFPLGLRVITTSQLQQINTTEPPTTTNVAEVAGHVLGQFPGPTFAHEVATVVPSDPDSLPLNQARSYASAPHVLAPQTRTGKKNWFQKYIWDYKK